MHILFLTQIIPYPPDAGPKVKTWHVLRYLAELGHRVTLASFVRPEEEIYIADVQEVCAGVHTVPIRRSRMADVGYFLRSQLTGRPFLIERDDLAQMRDLIRHLLETEKIDAIHADQLTMTQFALPDANKEYPESKAYSSQKIKNETNGPRALRDRQVLIFDAHNAVWTIVERMRQTAPWFLKPLASLEARRIKRYEGMIVQNFDHTLAVTEPDRQALLEAAAFYDPSIHLRPGRITVVPIAVDTSSTQPVRRQPGSANIVSLGTLHYPPNADGIRWFLKEVFPLVRREAPRASLTIVGKNPPQDFLLAAASSAGAIVVTGYVPDLTPHLEEAALMVVPVRAGGGMRVRILEAFARGMPVVTTTVGLEGIEARPGEDVLIADTPAEFSERVVELLEDEQLQARLSANGRRLAETRYDWQVVLKKMHEMYREVESERARRATNHG